MDEVESIATQLNVNYYFSLVAFVVLYYDFILTFPSEIERFWSGGFSWAALLFFINRYLSMLGHVPVILQTFWQTNNENCMTLQIYHQIYSIVLQILFGILLIMRTYALYSRSRLILYIMIVSAFLSIAVACWGITGKHTSPPPITTDIPGYLAIAWGAMSVFDTVIFILTAAKALFTPWTSRWGLVRVVVRDVWRFDGGCSILVAINLANILTLLPLIKGVATLFTNMYVPPISSDPPLTPFFLFPSSPNRKAYTQP
ncbi:hypothetical protein JAAARDRAFT_32772 [Jaapia argillacea MUCL 33604]|uniref:DUF6533 domain-containing protein n=1 Tax=Jaapia argillacea MUCL 33604 TaxID=933084 RepID=A0A067QCR9_9AGAM|nr:hypothetical protein JAAARDRAFT_32772 [Jaapia argillacea MUCL 33604]